MTRLLVLILLVTACATERASEQCKEVCKREAQCVEQMNEEKKDGPEQKFDQSECIAACAALERDAEGKKLVEKHVACAASAADCTALLSCQ